MTMSLDDDDDFDFVTQNSKEISHKKFLSLDFFFFFFY